jgi:hypothetical protein
MDILIPLLFALFSPGTLPALFSEFGTMRDANEHYSKGDYRSASTLYLSIIDRKPEGNMRREAQFNLADAQFCMKQYNASATLFEKLSTGPGKNGMFERNARYNEGNAIAMAAFSSPKEPRNPELLRKALACYRPVLLADPRNTDARINYEIVLRALQKLTPPPAPKPDEKPSPASPPPSTTAPLSSDVTNLVLENAMQDEKALLRKYFRPVQNRRPVGEKRDW